MSRGDGLYRRGKTWWVTVTLPNGQRARRSTETRDYQQAKTVRDEIRGELAAGRPAPHLSRATLADGCELARTDYQAKGRRSLGTLETSLKRLTDFFGADCPLARITWGDTVRYRLHRQGEGLKPATINKHLAALKHLLRLARKDGQLAHVPEIDIPDPKNARRGFFEQDELEAVLEHLAPVYHPVVRFGYLTGWRIRSEVLPLTWRQVDFTAGTVRLEPGTTKNAEGRVFPFDALPALAALLDALQRTREGPRVFHDAGRPIGYRSFLDAWNAACQAAEVLRIPHDLRRTAVRNLERAGVARSVAMQLTGHKTEAVYRRYAVVAEQDLRDGVAKLAGSSGGPASGV